MLDKCAYELRRFEIDRKMILLKNEQINNKIWCSKLLTNWSFTATRFDLDVIRFSIAQVTSVVYIWALHSTELENSNTIERIITKTSDSMKTKQQYKLCVCVCVCVQRKIEMTTVSRSMLIRSQS